jgi:hypothetical protein
MMAFWQQIATFETGDDPMLLAILSSGILP